MLWMVSILCELLIFPGMCIEPVRIVQDVEISVLPYVRGACSKSAVIASFSQPFEEYPDVVLYDIAIIITKFSPVIGTNVSRQRGIKASIARPSILIFYELSVSKFRIPVIMTSIP